MAEIDKALPNVDETIEVTQEEMVQDLSEPANQGGPTEVIENEDGSVDINYGEDQNLPPPTEHNANLADYLDETESGRLSTSLIENYRNMKKNQNRFKVPRARLTRFWLKLLHSFRLSLIKSYSRLMDQ